MILKNRVFFTTILIFTLFFALQLFADCPHCYTVAKVKIVRAGEGDLTGYIPIYSSESSGKKFLKGRELKNDLSKDEFRKKIIFTAKYYSFKKIGTFVAEEDIGEIKSENIKSIVFIKWIKNFNGAGSFSSLPERKITLLESAKSMQTIRHSHSVSDTVFINPDYKIPAKEFKLFTDYEPEKEGVDELYELYDILLYPENYKRRHKKYPSTDFIADLLEKAGKMATGHVEKLSFRCKNRKVESYLSLQKQKYLKRSYFYSAVLEYLQNPDSQKLRSFIKTRIENDDIRKKSVTVMDRDDKISDRVVKIKEIVKILYHELTLKNEEKLFHRVADETGIVIIIQVWD